MGISFSRYVNINSGVGGRAQAARRDLIARIFTNSDLIPTGTVVEFTGLDDVGTHFATSSEEYQRAQRYFGYLSKEITRAGRIGFARWADVDTAPQVFGAKPASLTELQAITAGEMFVSIGGSVLSLTGIDLSGAASLTAVAAIIQTAIQTGTGVVFTAATVTYNPAAARFEFVGGETGAAEISITAGAANDVAGSLGWLFGAIVSNGVLAESVTEVLSDLTEINNNFGSFAFSAPLTDDQVLEAALWNAATDPNILFQFHHGVVPADAATLAGMLDGVRGVGLTVISATDNEYDEMLPMAALAATDFEAPNGTINYMFLQDSTLTPKVATNADANTFDALGVNYYGSTQTAGQIINFYQRGFLFGGANDPRDINKYSNEQWLKDAVGVNFLNAMLSRKISANPAGRASLIGSVNGTINQALVNGTILVGGTLTDLQRASVLNLTADPLAFHQVEGAGYWLNIDFSTDIVDGVTVTTADYLLIYNDDDAIRAVNGAHVLI